MDEIHERSIDVDVTILLLREILRENEVCDLRVVLTSATIDVNHFTEYCRINPQAIVEIGGRVHTVTWHFLEDLLREDLKKEDEEEDEEEKEEEEAEEEKEEEEHVDEEDEAADEEEEQEQDEKDEAQAEQEEQVQEQEQQQKKEQKQRQECSEILCHNGAHEFPTDDLRRAMHKSKDETVKEALDHHWDLNLSLQSHASHGSQVSSVRSEVLVWIPTLALLSL